MTMTEQERAFLLKQKLTALLQDQAFVKQLAGLEGLEEARAAFAKKGVEMTADETKAVAKLLDRAVKNGGELTGEDLEAVAGGFWFPSITNPKNQAFG